MSMGGPQVHTNSKSPNQNYVRLSEFAGGMLSAVGMLLLVVQVWFILTVIWLASWSCLPYANGRSARRWII